ncbi:G-type lectin S-receptor-like serine/threonine-protein kinase RLK1 [Apostasia shenzhenica]|uniref:Receptor-like serine/threonine-protein kinase n=1 Tax=Apostasia shenzhenica TaxID=1088818 RepID=A0A2H9ZVK8_9ASPA|nr:G-type lectin S-receptor-like serine/threonine-protein kinase RLK1 [Apostasia shenzhenica]
MASPLFLLLLLLGPFISPGASQSSGNITLNSFITTADNSSWRSPFGDFAVGFLPLPSNSSFFLLAVWYPKLAGDATVVWTANRDNPVAANSTAVLTVNGNLCIRDPGGAEVWNAGITGASYAAVLDTGNFIVAVADGISLWESFGYSTDTILPTQTLGSGSKLVAKLADDDFGDGRFKMVVDDAGDLQFYLIAAPTGYQYTSYWSSNSNTSNLKLVFNLSGTIDLISPAGSVIATLTSATTKSTADYYHRGTLDPDGVFRHYVRPKTSTTVDGGWVTADFKPTDICQQLVSDVGSGACGFNSYCGDDQSGRVSCQCPDGYSFLDPNRTYRGCKPDFAAPVCSAGNMDDSGFRMVSMRNLDYPLCDYEHFNPMGEDDCQKECLNDCLCAMSVSDGGNNCWKKKLPLSNGRKGSFVSRIAFLKVGNGNNTLLEHHQSKNRKWLVPGSVILGCSVLLNFVCISAVMAVLHSRRRKQTQNRIVNCIPHLNLKSFTYKELEEATKGFGEVLGKGAFGTVYKGYLDPHRASAPAIAVKKLREHEPASEKEFINEVRSIVQTHHKNLVRLLGYCNEGAERILVYQYMSKGSLADYLFNSVRPAWNQRVEILFGIARGLRYLHDECGTQIIHCDIKPQNVLLDDEFVARISDFGLAKLLMAGQTRTMTEIRGTKGYVAPEWFKNTGISAKVDVYSFGVLVLEIVSCRRNVEKEMEDEKAVLTFWASDCYATGRIDLLVAGDVAAMMDIRRVERFVKLAMWCVQEEPGQRPTMAQVTLMLEGQVEIPAPPRP